MRLTIEASDDGGAAVLELRPVLVATFADPAEAQRYVTWRQGEAILQAARADTAASREHFDAVAEALRTQCVQAPAPEADVDTASEAEPRICEDCGEDPAQVGSPVCSHCEAYGAEVAAAEEITPDASPVSTLAPEQPAAEITPPPPVERRVDPYHEKGEAVRRLLEGEQMALVATDLGLDTARLKAVWMRVCKARKAMGAAVPVAEAPAADDGWAHCARCRTKFNAARAQADLNLPQRPTRCAACRS